MTATQDTTTGVGRVARVTGPVVDVEFPAEHMPELFNALNVDVTFDGGRG
jgi:F-type H+-transporting ATPase subunit beta